MNHGYKKIIAYSAILAAFITGIFVSAASFVQKIAADSALSKKTIEAGAVCQKQDKPSGGLTAAAINCSEERAEQNEAMFVGCNGFF